MRRTAAARRACGVHHRSGQRSASRRGRRKRKKRREGEGEDVPRALDVPVLRDRGADDAVARDAEVRDLGREARRGVVRAHARLDELHARLPVALPARRELRGARGDGDGEGDRAARCGAEHERPAEEAREVILFRGEAP